jgi:lysozyme family protein
MDQKACVAAFIKEHEGGLSTDPTDTGNWLGGVCVGSKYGVTAAVLCKHRSVNTITPAQMAALDMDEAVTIGLDLFYREPRLNLLSWNQVTASVLDMGWGAGPRQSVKLLQRMVGAADDGEVGRYTARAYADYLDNHGLENSARAWGNVRNAFYDHIIAIRPKNARFRNGWRNRTASFLPGTTWWKRWAAA